MGKFLIEGGRRLSGTLKAERAKNAVLPILAATLLTDETVFIKDCPDIRDVKIMTEILTLLGAECSFTDGGLSVNCKNVNNFIVPSNLAEELRSSVLTAGGLLARFRRAEIPFPGGCKIGERPIDIHVKAFNALGAKSNIDESGMIFKCPTFKGGRIILDVPSVGATENAMIAACAAEGETLIVNAAKEPEIVDLAEFICAIGGKVYGAGSDNVRIVGVKKFGGTEYKPVFDRIEVGTYLVAAAITGGEIEISGVKSENISSLISKLCDNSCKLSVKNDIIYLRSGARRTSFFVRTGYYPEFPTDMQAQMTALAATSLGLSAIKENVFESRFAYTAELRKMGANISVHGRTAVVNGVKRLSGANVTATDLRGGAALVLAGLNAEGKTVVDGISHVERGYSHMDEKLRSLGADVIKTD